MQEYDNIIGTISLTLGASWASGINLYAAIFMLGMMGTTGSFDLPPGLEILQNPLVIGAAGLMYAVEFVADKIPVVDSSWDAIHTFIRIPAGAALAYGAAGELGPAAAIAATIVGGGMATTTHATKAGTRALINTSPEPFTNWTASVSEDVAVVGGLWAALNYPWVFLGFLVVFLLLLVWLLPKIFRGIKKVFGFLGRMLGISEKEKEQPETTTNES